MTIKSFKCAIERLGVITQMIDMDGDPAIFIDFADATKKQETMISRLAIEHGMKIDIADKGVIFS